MQARTHVVVMVLLMAAVSTCVRAESAEKLGKPLNDNDIVVMEFNAMEYPLLATSSGSEGVVVVKVKLDNTGRVLEAVALGLMAHQMGGFDSAKIRAAFAIPEDYTCMAMIAIGYPASPDILDGNLKERELASRSRQPLGAHFFSGAWGKGLVK